MRLRMIVAVAVSVILAGTLGFAQGQGRVVHQASIDVWEGVFVAGCIDDYGNTFDVMNHYEASLDDTVIYDKTGNIKQFVRTIKFTTDRFWNSDTEKSLTGGPGERNEVRWTYENGVQVLLQFSGPMIRINLPGFGPIFIETGHMRINPTTYEVHFNSGHNNLWDADPAAAEALCNALK